MIPNKFFLHIINDSSRQPFFVNKNIKFQGKMYGVKVLFGKGSLIPNPMELIDKWPYDPKNLPAPPQGASDKVLCKKIK